MLNQTFTKTEIHQLAQELFKDIPFQTDEGKNRMKLALHLYRSGNVYNIMRENEELRATMLADANKIHIFLNLKTGFYGATLGSEQRAPLQPDIVYVTAALLALFASVDSVGAFLDLWKTSHETKPTTVQTNIPIAIGDTYFRSFQKAFAQAYEKSCGSQNHSYKEAYFITCNNLIISAMDTEKKKGFACGLSFSYIPLYAFSQIIRLAQTNSAFFNADCDTFTKRILQLAEKELRKLPKEIFQTHTDTKVELTAYADLLNTCIALVGMEMMTGLYCEFYSFDLAQDWHEKQLGKGQEAMHHSAQHILKIFHLVASKQYQEASAQANQFIAAREAQRTYHTDWRALSPFIEKTILMLAKDDRVQAVTDFLQVLHRLFVQEDNRCMLESVMQLYIMLSDIPAYRLKSVAALRQMLPESLPHLAQMTWNDKNYADWIGLVLLLPPQMWGGFRKEIQVLSEANNPVLLPLLHRYIQHNIEEKNKNSYLTAIHYLRQLKNIYQKNAKKDAWRTYYAFLQNHYRNLRSFQNMLKKDISA